MRRYLHVLARNTGYLAAAIAVTSCSLPGSKENVEVAASLVATQTSVPFSWRRDAAGDEAARARVEELLAGGVTLQDAVGIAYLSSPDLQLSLEQLEIARSELVAATTPPNPVLIVGLHRVGDRAASSRRERARRS